MTNGGNDVGVVDKIIKVSILLIRFWNNKTMEMLHKDFVWLFYKNVVSKIVLLRYTGIIKW